MKSGTVVKLKRIGDSRLLEEEREINSLDDLTSYVQSALPLKSDSDDRLLTFDPNYVWVDLYKEHSGRFEEEVAKNAKERELQLDDHRQALKEHFSFYIMDELWFVPDIKKYLNEKFDSKTNCVTFYASDNKLPIAFSGWKTKRYQLPFKSHATFVREIFYRYCRDDEIIVDRSLNQI